MKIICDNLVMASLITASLSCSGTALSGHAIRKKLDFGHINFIFYSIIGVVASMVSELDSGSSGPGSSPGRDIVLCYWARHLTLTVTLTTQVYKWVPANLMLGVTLRWTSIPFRGE